MSAVLPFEELVSFGEMHTIIAEAKAKCSSTAGVLAAIDSMKPFCDTCWGLPDDPSRHLLPEEIPAINENFRILADYINEVIAALLEEEKGRYARLYEYYTIRNELMLYWSRYMEAVTAANGFVQNKRKTYKGGGRHCDHGYGMKLIEESRIKHRDHYTKEAGPVVDILYIDTLMKLVKMVVVCLLAITGFTSLHFKILELYDHMDGLQRLQSDLADYIVVFLAVIRLSCPPREIPQAILDAILDDANAVCEFTCTENKLSSFDKFKLWSLNEFN